MESLRDLEPLTGDAVLVSRQLFPQSRRAALYLHVESSAPCRLRLVPSFSWERQADALGEPFWYDTRQHESAYCVGTTRVVLTFDIPPGAQAVRYHVAVTNTDDPIRLGVHQYIGNTP